MRPDARVRAVSGPLLLLAAALAAAAAAAFQAPAFVRLPLGLAATLFLPGLALTSICFPRADELGMVERLGLALALSFGLIVLVALAINATPWGLQSEPMVVGLTGCTVILALAGIARRQWQGRQPLPERSMLTFNRPALAGLVGLALLSGSAVLALGVLVHASSRGATEFYYLGSGNLAEAFPGSVASGAPTSLTVGINNREVGPARYRVVVQAAGRQLAAASADLQPGQGWQRPLTFTLDRQDNAQRLDVLLFEGSSVTPLRSLALWVNLGTGPS